MLDLATMVAPLGVDEFFDRQWPDHAWWSTSDPDRVASTLAEAPQLESAAAVLEEAGQVTIFTPDGTHAIVADGKAARPFYMLGMTCYLNARHVPGLQAIKDRLNAELGLPAGALECEIFCSSGDSGVQMHSDFDMNFALLLEGRKRWRIAPNEHIRNQTGVCGPPSREAVSPLQLELADRQPFPEDMPEDSTVVDVEAGGVIFLPRGWWHDTKAQDDCLQVNFVIKRPLWLRVLTGALGDRLMRDPEWRGFALDLYGPPERRERALEALAGLMPSLRRMIDELMGDGDDVAAARRLLEWSDIRAPDGA